MEELSVRLSSSALTRWIAYYELEPFGAWRDNYHVAQLCQLMASAWSSKGQEFSLADFMYTDPDQRHATQQQEIAESLLAYARTQADD